VGPGPISNLNTSINPIKTRLAEMHASPNAGEGVIGGVLTEAVVNGVDTGKGIGFHSERENVSIEIILPYPRHCSSDGTVSRHVIRERGSELDQRFPVGVRWERGVGVVENGIDWAPMYIEVFGIPSGDGGVSLSNSCEGNEPGRVSTIEALVLGDVVGCFHVLTGWCVLSRGFNGEEDGGIGLQWCPCVGGSGCSWENPLVVDLNVVSLVNIGPGCERWTWWSELATGLKGPRPLLSPGCA